MNGLYRTRIYAGGEAGCHQPGRHPWFGPHPYPAYRPSGIPWLGDVPAHWEVRRLKTVAHIISGATPSTNTPSYWDGTIDWLTPDDLGKLSTRYIETGARRITQEGYDSCGATLAPEGSIAISTRAPIGHIGILGHPACVNQGCRLLSPNDTIKSEYIYFCLTVARGQLEALGQGSTFTELSRRDLGNFPIPLPPLAEQAAIVRYLDDADQRIRRYVSARRRLIALLEEEKQAIINRAVTRGLDPSAPLKPSGIPWLGNIPAHWEVRRLKQVCRLAYGDSLSAESRELGEVPVYGSNGQVGHHSVANTEAPCIIIGRKGSFGKVTYVDRAAFAIDTAFFIDKRYTQANIRWLSYLLPLLGLDTISHDSAVPGLNRDDARVSFIPLPPLAEQAAIVEYLDRTTADVDAAITRARRQIELLEEYRTRLIADVVTGKIDVRAPQEPSRVSDSSPQRRSEG